MRYRIDSESNWYKTLRGAKNRAIDKRGIKSITVNVVDETGIVVWSTDELPKLNIRFSHTEHVKPQPPQQGGLF